MKLKVLGYHVHLYFEHGKPSEKVAKLLVSRIKKNSSDKIDETLVYSQLVGPHTQPNYALHIKTEGFLEIVSSLQLDSSGLSILIHPETGNDEQDHAERAMWLGKQLTLDMTYFTWLKNRNPNV